jgi:hypothetical protein
MYEFTVAASMVVTGAYLLCCGAGRATSARSWSTVLLTLGLAVTAYTQAAQLVLALHSYRLGIHVSVAFAAAVHPRCLHHRAQPIQDRREAAIATARRPVPGSWLGCPRGGAGAAAYRPHAVAFPL